MSDIREDEGFGSVDPKSDPQYIQFKCLPPGGALNRWSHMITREHDFPGAQVSYFYQTITMEFNMALRVSRIYRLRVV